MKRVEIQLREVINLPFKKHQKQFCNSIFKCGWTLFPDVLPDLANRKSSSKQVNQINPRFNESFSFEIPAFQNGNEGFVYLEFNANNSNKNLLESYVPLKMIPNFHPIHFVFLLSNEKRTKLSVSLIKTFLHTTNYNDAFLSIGLSNLELNPLSIHNKLVQFSLEEEEEE